MRLRAGLRFNLVAALAHVERLGRQPLVLIVRTSLDGNRWSGWQRLAIDNKTN